MRSAVGVSLVTHTTRSAACIALCASLTLAMFSCMSQPVLAQSQSPSTSASPAASNGACRLNTNVVCQPVNGNFLVEGPQLDWQMLQQNSPRTAEITAVIYGPDGKLIAEVQCHLNTQTRSVSSAQVLSGPPFSPQDAAYLRKRGFCEKQ